MPIEHVVVLCLENRSFDHMLGFLSHESADFDALLHGGPFDNEGYAGGPRVAAAPGAAFGPDRWFCSVPGETWPNRNYLHAATSDGETDIEIREYENRTIFELLEKELQDDRADWRIYDHRPPTGVPAPDDGRGTGARLLHAIWHRQVDAFDFTMLGVRVPAVLVSPLIERGTVAHEEFEHASVPSTLRALFAPGAKPLTRRDAWARPFHPLASRKQPRTDLPDLSRYVRPPVRLAAELGPAAVPEAGQVPEYYRDFIKQADLVRDHLRAVG
ncbi:MAG TPA: alkaline phosphatase family protein [Streptosporangiaceae bacterium]|jgi:hypothetical protein